MHETAWFKERKSIRCFLGEPVPRGVITEILGEARTAPSWANTQPWEVAVVSGEPLSLLKETYCACLREQREPNPDLAMPSHVWPAPFQARIKRLGIELFNCVHIARDDKEARARHYDRMYRLFGAPHLVLVLLDGNLTLPYPLFDLGAFVQTLCLAATARGLGTCILAAAARYPEVARKTLGLDPAQKIVIGLALGFPDQQSAYNRFCSEREPVEAFTTWIE